MICIRCDYDSKRRERFQRTCPKCRKSFAFDPNGGDILTDLAFQNAINAVSSNGHLRWGVEHLYYEVCRRRPGWRPHGRTLIVVASLVLVFFATYIVSAHPYAAYATLFTGVVFIIYAGRWLTSRNQLPVTLKKFNRMWERWQQIHGRPESVLTRRSTRDTPVTSEPDVVEYSFDRVVICDRARTVDLLLANNFHFENNCAVLSIEGYPPHVFETVRTMLRRNPRLEIYALHDATGAGCRLAHRLAHDADWFEGREVIDVGLRPHHAKRYRGLLIEPKHKPVPVGNGVSKKEASWLSVYSLELAALRPEQIIRAVFIAISGHHHDSFG